MLFIIDKRDVLPAFGGYCIFDRSCAGVIRCAGESQATVEIELPVIPDMGNRSCVGVLPFAG